MKCADIQCKKRIWTAPTVKGIRPPQKLAQLGEMTAVIPPKKYLPRKKVSKDIVASWRNNFNYFAYFFNCPPPPQRILKTVRFIAMDCSETLSERNYMNVGHLGKRIGTYNYIINIIIINQVLF